MSMWVSLSFFLSFSLSFFLFLSLSVSLSLCLSLSPLLSPLKAARLSSSHLLPLSRFPPKVLMDKKKQKNYKIGSREGYELKRERERQWWHKQKTDDVAECMGEAGRG